jgi:hypothetical protein
MEGVYDPDLNHDGVTDFSIRLEGNDSSSLVTVALSCLGANGASSVDQVLGSSMGLAKDVKAGFVVGGWAKNQKNRFSDRVQFMAEEEWVNGKTYGFRGLWANGGKGVRNRYLGLRFKVEGGYHYGWARFNVSFPNRTLHAVLTGYAYETIAGKAIVAGQTKGTGDSTIEQPDAALTTPTPDTPQLPMLGALALGAPGLSIWRKMDT